MHKYENTIQNNEDKKRRKVMSIITLTEENIKEVKEGKKVVEFWAPWCSYCKRLAPALNQLAEEYADKINIYQVNIDELERLSADYGIETIPTLISIKDGKKDKELIAPQSKSEIVAWLKEENLLQNGEEK